MSSFVQVGRSWTRAFAAVARDGQRAAALTVSSADTISDTTTIASHGSGESVSTPLGQLQPQLCDWS